MKKIIFYLFLISTLFTSVASWAQDQAMGKHPKVIEVEMLISKQAMTFLQQRIPTGPVYVNVDVEPLRRNAGVKSEQLPYFYSEDEVGDEWDVLDTPMVLLLSRIKKATIKVEVPNNTTDFELSDLKEKLYEQLKLIPGRDSITIDRKAFVAKPTTESKDYSLYYFIAGMALITFGGLFVILRFGVKHHGAPASASAPASTSSSATAGMPARAHASGGKSTFQASGLVNSKVNGDINFKDSLRAADMLKEKLHGVINAPIFPLLSDLLILEELSEKSLSSFGAFVFEMPRKHQQKVFFRGRSEKWFRGYVEAASVDMDCFLAVEKMLRSRNATGSEKWEELLVQVWRLGDEAPLFLKQIPAEESFTILGHMPKAFSVPTAKKAFPGGWARILESKEYSAMEDEDKLADYVERTLQLKPYFSFKSIDEYKKDLELVDYLRTTSIKDEEDIYESLSSESPIHNLRPPFYAVLKAEPEDFKEIFSQFDLSDWATVVINSPRDYLKRITNELDEKKKYLFSSYLKQLDENPVSAKEQIELREEMGKRFHQLMLSKSMNKNNTNKKDKEDDNNDNNSQAA